MKENQRIRLSRRMLRDSLIKLLHEKSIHKISIREICDLAEINRTTFYKYYGSQYDLFKEMEDELLKQIDADLKDCSGAMDNDLQRLTNIMAYIEKNIELCRLLLNNNIDPMFPEKLIHTPQINSLLSLYLTENYTADEMNYIFCFVVNGGFNIIKRWVNKEQRERPEEVAALISNIIRKLSAPSAI